MISTANYLMHFNDDIESPTAPGESWDCTCPLLTLALMVTSFALMLFLGHGVFLSLLGTLGLTVFLWNKWNEWNRQPQPLSERELGDMFYMAGYTRDAHSSSIVRIDNQSNFGISPAQIIREEEPYNIAEDDIDFLQRLRTFNQRVQQRTEVLREELRQSRERLRQLQEDSQHQERETALERQRRIFARFGIGPFAFEDDVSNQEEEAVNEVGPGIFIDLYDHELANLPVKCPCGETMNFNGLISLYKTEEKITLCCSQAIDLCAMTFDSTNLTPYDDDDLIGPITLEPMEKPLVVCPRDHTIDYESIKGWVNQKKDTCPLCRSDLKDVYVPNLHMFVQMHPDATVEEFLDTYNISLSGNL